MWNNNVWTKYFDEFRPVYFVHLYTVILEVVGFNRLRRAKYFVCTTLVLDNLNYFFNQLSREKNIFVEIYGSIKAFDVKWCI